MLRAKSGDKSEAQRLLVIREDRIISDATADAGSNSWRWCARLIDVSNQWTALGNPENARDALAHARSIAVTIQRRSQNHDDPAVAQNLTEADRELARISLGEARAGEMDAAKQTLDLALASARQVKTNGMGVNTLWMIAREQAWGGGAQDAPATIALALQTGRIDPTEIAMLDGYIAMGMAKALGTTADLSWIDKLTTPEEKCFAYSGAAAGMASGPGEQLHQ
jgi:hypothetical protein